AVLTMERVDGIRIDNVDQIREAGFDPIAIAQYTMQSLAQQILEVGMFHADPHPGNFVVCADGAIGIYDFGLVGSLDERIRERMLFLAMAVTERDPVRVVDEIASLGAVPGEGDRRALERDIGHLLTQYVGVTLREMPLVTILDDAMTMIRRYRLRLPAELALLVKTATMAEALARRLDPDINAVEVGEPMIRAAVRRFYTPSFWRDRFRGRPLEVALLSAALPGHIQRFISRLDRNDFTFNMQVNDLPTTLHEMNSMVNRLVLAIIAAAGAIGTAMLVLAVKPVWGSWQGYALLLIFIAVTLLIINVLFRVWRAGRR
ncbi:MAG TPA: AarF/UbiB family protein, partial [Thermomicrobiales bacterium]|nr:AarF/UbiB family protein [Thermomicrobiales bacterium]